MVPNEAKNLLKDILDIEMFEMHRSLAGRSMPQWRV